MPVPNSSPLKNELHKGSRISYKGTMNSKQPHHRLHRLNMNIILVMIGKKIAAVSPDRT